MANDELPRRKGTMTPAGELEVGDKIYYTGSRHERVIESITSREDGNLEISSEGGKAVLVVPPAHEIRKA